MALITVTTDVDVYLDDISTEDLLQELQDRGTPTGDQNISGKQTSLSVEVALQQLRLAGCPEELLAAIEQWAGPLVTEDSLQRWVAMSQR